MLLPLQVRKGITVLNIFFVGNPVQVQIIIPHLPGLPLQIIELSRFFILNHSNFQTGIHLFGPGLQLDTAGLPVSQKLILCFPDVPHKIRMIGKIVRRQNNIGILIDGHFPGTGFQFIFRIGGCRSAAGNQNQNDGYQK